MTVLIDSNVFIGFLKGEKSVVDQINEIVSKKRPLFISTVSIYEVYVGIIANLYLKGGRPSKVPELLSIYERLLMKFGILSLTKEAAEKAAEIFAQSQGKGLTIKEKDCQIAGIALVHGISQIFTRDEQDFARIFDLTGLQFIIV